MVRLQQVLLSIDHHSDTVQESKEVIQALLEILNNCLKNYCDGSRLIVITCQKLNDGLTEVDPDTIHLSNKLCGLF